eukprot:scaffold1382_cov127-Isochrysis_galbana.AAC.4
MGDEWERGGGVTGRYWTEVSRRVAASVTGSRPGPSHSHRDALSALVSVVRSSPPAPTSGLKAPPPAPSPAALSPPSVPGPPTLVTRAGPRPRSRSSAPVALI